MLYDNGYAYAKACGIIGKSFLKKKKSSLSGLRTLGEFEALVFPDSRKEPHHASLEKRIKERALHQIKGVVLSYSKPPALFMCLLKEFERGGPDTEPDYNFYRDLSESLRQLEGEDRDAAQKLLNYEISLLNCVWALRLRFYYKKTSEETAGYLIDALSKEGDYCSGTALSLAARESLALPLDVRRQWDGWKWEKFLNKETPQFHWTVNPRYFQNAVSAYLRRLAMCGFHGMPASVSAILCFIKLIQYEEELLASFAQGLALGIDGSGIFKMLDTEDEASFAEGI